jgi:hypothetical protein
VAVDGRPHTGGEPLAQSLRVRVGRRDEDLGQDRPRPRHDQRVAEDRAPGRDEVRPLEPKVGPEADHFVEVRRRSLEAAFPQEHQAAIEPGRVEVGTKRHTGPVRAGGFLVVSEVVVANAFEEANVELLRLTVAGRGEQSKGLLKPALFRFQERRQEKVARRAQRCCVCPCQGILCLVALSEQGERLGLLLPQ